MPPSASSTSDIPSHFSSSRDMVLTNGMVHHSNDLLWRAVAKTIRIHLTQDGRLDADDFDSQLAYCGDRIALVAISGASNVIMTAGR